MEEINGEIWERDRRIECADGEWEGMEIGWREGSEE